jgi:hypothetical protein
MGKMKKRIGWVIRAAAALIAVGAVVQELRLPPQERHWHGKVYGVPYDFRPPNLQRASRSWWNPNDRSLFTPQPFGVGWVINLHRLFELGAALSERLGR